MTDTIDSGVLQMEATLANAGQQGITTIDVFIDRIAKKAIAVGWEMWDDISTSSKVIRSRGSDNQGAWVYIRLDLYSPGYMSVMAYTWWNKITHIGSGANYIYNTSYLNMSVPCSNSWGTFFWFITKDVIFLSFFLNIDSFQQVYTFTNYCNVFVGHVLTHPSIVDIPTKTLTVQATLNGTSLAVSDSIGLKIGQILEIVEKDGAAREQFKIVGLNGNVIITESGVICAYPVGSLVGVQISSRSYGMYRVNNNSSYPVAMLGGGEKTTGSSITPSKLRPILSGLSNTDKRCSNAGFYVNDLLPIAQQRIESLKSSAQGFFPEGMFLTSNDNPSCTMRFVKNADDSNVINGIISGLTNVNTIDVAGSPYVENSLIGKYLIFTSGNSSGASRKIISNSSNTITFDKPILVGSPLILGDSFVICDTCYFGITSNGLGYLFEALDSKSLIVFKDNAYGFFDTVLTV